MQYLWTVRRLGLLFGLLAASAFDASAQKSTGPASSAPSPTRPATPTNNPTVIPNNLPTIATPGSSRPIFFDGRVQFDDGTTSTTDVRIERVCGGTPYMQAHTDSKGNFYFQLGTNTQLDADASEASMVPNGPRPSGNPRGMNSLSSPNNTFGCEIRAAYPGYRSDVFEIPQNNYDTEGVHVGTLVLHRLAAVQGTTLSLTTALAPKKAQKEYEKGVASARKGDFEEAEKRFTSATEAYPKYAIAWYALGEVNQRESRTEAARQAFQSAIASDNHYVSPYNQLALLAGQEGKWQDVADYSRKALDLNPVEFPSAYWYNAVGNFHLQHMAEAEKSARELIKLDTTHLYPQAENLLGNLLLQKGDAAQASEHLRAYLALNPKAQDAESVRHLLDRLDQANRASAK
jgi:tetratricopeptide (TPR) repeat protein